MGYSDWFHFDVKKIKQETEKAFLVSLEESGEKVWVPKSVIANVEDYKKGICNTTLSVKEWWAKKEGLCPP